MRWPKLLSRFTWIVLAECALISALFLYWANRITGEMYNFNGYFFYAVHLLGLFLIAGTVSGWQANLRPDLGRWSRLVWALPLLSIVAVAGEFRNPDRGMPAIQKISDELRAPDRYELLFQHDDWLTAMGVANRLARRRQDFCVTGNWGFMFGYEYVCAATAAPRKVVITQTAAYDLGTAAPEVAGYHRYGRPGGAQGRILWAGGRPLLERAYRQPRLRSGSRCGRGGVPCDADRVGAAGASGAVSLNGRRVGVADGIWKSSVSFAAARGRAAARRDQPDDVRYGELRADRGRRARVGLFADGRAHRIGGTEMRGKS